MSVVFASVFCYAADPASEVTKVRQAINKANDTHDVATLDKLMIDDFVFISRTGTVADKKAFLDNVKDQAMITRWRIDDACVRVYGDSAVMTERMTGNARSGPVTIRTTAVFVKQGGNWKEASLAASPVTAPAAK